MWTQIRLLIQEQSDLCLHCLNMKLQKHLGRQQKQTKIFVVGTLRVNGYGAFDS